MTFEMFCYMWAFLVFQDMEKWAKKLNAQKEHLKEEVKVPVAEPIIDISSVSLPSSAAADAGFSMLEKVKHRLCLNQ